jgi:2-octaprenyl-6-methoxyphenol hydroxylase
MRAMWNVAIVGAGPVGLAAACALAQALPTARVTLFDAQAIDAKKRDDARALALNLGSIQWLRQLGQWPQEAAEPITEVSVSQLAPGRTDLRLRASELRVSQLGAVLPYADLLVSQQQAWLQQTEAEPQRLLTCAETQVRLCKPKADGQVELDAGGVVETFDTVLLAEGGLFADQPSKPWHRDYGQTAWVGTVTLSSDWPRGLAVERFTRQGPLAVLPLPDRAGQRRAALVWCTAPGEDGQSMNLTRMQALLPRAAHAITGFETPLKPFALGLNADTAPLHGRVLRVGNAAQTLHPVAGQGLNLGLRDAHEWVRQLRQAKDLDSALARCARNRLPDRLALLLATDVLARAFTWEAAPLALAREAGLRALHALPPLRHALARSLMFGLR